MSSIPIAGPSITDLEIDLVQSAVETAWYGEAGSFVRRFESEFADAIGCRFAVALPSCTSAIHLALAALGIGPGDEVIVPDVTWIASSAPLSYLGAVPVFADVDPVTWCLNSESVEALIGPRTRAIIAVDLYGGIGELSRLEKIAAQHGLALIEDAAEAVGAISEGRWAGSFGNVGVFSFHGSKTLTTGEGGMLVTNERQLYETVRVLQDHGRAPGDTQFENRQVAYKYKMTDLQAALGVGQLQRLEELVAMKRSAFGWYRELLADLDGVALNHERAGTRNTYWMVTAVPDERHETTKQQLAASLLADGIATRPFFNPLSSLTAYAGSPDRARARSTNATSYRLSRTGINLPSAPTLTESEVEFVCDRFRKALRRE